MRDRRLGDVAWAHSGDKGDMVNIGVVVHDPANYPDLIAALTRQRISEHFGDICKGEVHIYPLPNLHAVNVVLTQVLDGGPVRSLRLDPQGKTLGDGLLLLPLATRDP
jgi:hypothetical protein